MKKIITIVFATLVAVYGYSQDGVHLPLSGGTLTGNLYGVSGVFSGELVSNAGLKALGGGGYAELRAVPTTYNTSTLELWSNYGYNVPVKALSIFNKNTTLHGSLTGTSAAFSGSGSFGDGGSGDRGIYLGTSGFQASLLYNANTGNLEISPRSGYNTIVTSGAVILNDRLTGTSAAFNTPMATSFPLTLGSNSSANALGILGRASDNFGVIQFRSNSNAELQFDITSSPSQSILRTFGANSLVLQTNNTTALTIDQNANTSLSGTLSGTSATFSTLQPTTTQLKLNNSNSGKHTHIGNFADNTYISNNWYYEGGHAYDNPSSQSASIVLSGDGKIDFNTNIANTIPVTRFSLDANGVATFTGALKGTSALFGGSEGYGGIVTIDNSSNQADVNHGILHLRNSAPYAIGNDASIMFTSRNSDGSFHPRASFGVKTSGDFTGDFVFNTRTGSDSWAEKFRITANGNVAIGTTNPQGYKLAVAGNVIAESVKVALQGSWPDYVFKPENKLLSLQEVEKYVHENNHLPEIPSETEVKKEGIDLGQMDAKLLKKIEELTLYMIEQNKELVDLRKIIQLQNERIAKLESQIK